MAVRDALKRYPWVYWPARKGRAALMAALPPKAFAGVPGRIHRNDTMMPAMTDEAAGAYNHSGAQAAVFVAGVAPQATEVLDLGCGYGRVLRHLKHRFPDARFTACDIERTAVRFCAREFDAVPVVSRPDLADVAFPTAPYDVVWMGSLLTHLDADANRAVMRTLAGITTPRAVIAFSTHGPARIDHLPRYGPGMAEHAAAVTASMRESGFAYAPYRHYSDDSYGIAFHDRAHVDELVAAEFAASTRLRFEPAGWQQHQDLHAFAVESGR